ncbi:MAG: DUF5060 domain-containing protein [Pseudomonadota bacterium]
MASISGETKTWHKISLDFTSPKVFTEEPDTFRDYRLDVTFTNQDTGEVIKIPGFFAADGDAANTSATSGNVWRANFNPPSEGEWIYEASFRAGNDIAVSTNPNAGQEVNLSGKTGSITVTPTDKIGDDFRAKGMILQDEGTHYLQHQGDGDYFVRGGPGIPENFLANQEIDGTKGGRHDFSTHARHYDGDGETWKNGQGNEVLGAINYLADDQDQNTMYVMLNTIGGDGQDVGPWVDDDLYGVQTHARSLQDAIDKTPGVNKDSFSTFDVSKLSQWETIFDHMDEKGIYKNILLQETENDQMLLGDGSTPVAGSSLSVEYMLYVKEMIARFGHNNGLQWNLGEENSNTQEELQDMAEYIKKVDAHDHLAVVHTFGHGRQGHEKVLKPLLGNEDFDGASFQLPESEIRDATIEYIKESKEAGDPWVISWDEDSSNNAIIEPGSNNPDSQNEVTLREGFWGHLTAGGSGGNWYFKGEPKPGADIHSALSHSFDQNMDDFTGFESVWGWTAAATEFFNQYIPFWEMETRDGLTTNEGDYVLAKEGEYYVSYLKYGQADDVKLDLRGQNGETFVVSWYDPRNGGDLIEAGTVSGGRIHDFDNPPNSVGKDWVLLARNVNSPEKPHAGKNYFNNSSNTDDTSLTTDINIDTNPGGTPTSNPPKTDYNLSNDTNKTSTNKGDAEMIYGGQNGKVLMDASSAKLNGPWKKNEGWVHYDTDQDNYSGSPNQNHVLELNFIPDRSGAQYVSFEAMRDKSLQDEGARWDEHNDAHMRVFNETTGEYVAWVDDDGGTHNSWIKVHFGGAYGVKQTAHKVDYVHSKGALEYNHAARFDAVAGDEYRIEIGGRSSGVQIDKVAVNHGSILHDLDGPVSPTTSGQQVAPQPQPQPEPEPPVSNDPVLVNKPAPVNKPDPVSNVDPEPQPPANDPGSSTAAPSAPIPGPGIAIDLYLVDSNTGQFKGKLGEHVKFNSNSEETIVAVPNGQVDRMEITVNNDVTQTEHVAPYAAFGDSNGDFEAGSFRSGLNEISVVAFDSNGNEIGSIQQEFIAHYGNDVPHPIEEPTPLPSPDDEPDFDFFIVDADSDTVLLEVKDGETYDHDIVKDYDNLAVVAIQDNGEQKLDIGSVVLDLNGNKITENVAPYASFGDLDGDVSGNGWSLDIGEEYTISAEAFSGIDGRGAFLGEEDLTFEFSNKDSKITETNSTISRTEADALEGLGLEVANNLILDF